MNGLLDIFVSPSSIRVGFGKGVRHTFRINGSEPLTNTSRLVSQGAKKNTAVMLIALSLQRGITSTSHR